MNKPISLVHKLQMDAQDSKIPVSDLLRQAKIIAVKLDVKELIDWTQAELSGYKQGDDAPEYRKVYGTLKARLPGLGWQVVPIARADLREMITVSSIGSPIGELESVVKQSSGKIIGLSLHPNQKHMLHELIPDAQDVAVELPSQTNHAIIEAVRNIILDWALKLEKAGILGENLSFSNEDKKDAQPLTQNFYAQNIGHVGNVFDQATVTNTINNGLSYDTDKIKQLVDQIKASSNALPESIREDVVLIADKLTDQISVSVDKQDTKIVSELLSSLRKIGESASGNLVARGIVAMVTGTFQ